MILLLTIIYIKFKLTIINQNKQNHLSIVTLQEIRYMSNYLECKNKECNNVRDDRFKCYGYCAECYLMNKIICEKFKKCIICNKAIQPIRNKRKNGRSGRDWKKRITHLSCYKAS